MHNSSHNVHVMRYNQYTTKAHIYSSPLIFICAYLLILFWFSNFSNNHNVSGIHTPDLVLTKNKLNVLNIAFKFCIQLKSRNKTLLTNPIFCLITRYQHPKLLPRKFNNSAAYPHMTYLSAVYKLS